MYKFQPIIKQALWGSESWAVSGFKGSETVVSGGPDDGTPLNQLVSRQRERLVGHANFSRFAGEFPLLVKFIDARRDLSIQVHPDDLVARRHGYERGKSEMWYVLSSAPGARLFNGLRQQLTPQQYKQMVADATITQALAAYDVSPGDVFYIPAGRIHSIGAGCQVAEIQQTSDVTYRIYDYNRRDAQGHLRPLHTEQAAESIDYNVLPDYRTPYPRLSNQRVPLVSSPHFTTALYDIDRPTTLDYTALDTFVILIGVAGGGTLQSGGQSASLRAGEALLLPATATTVQVEGTLTLLETYV